MTVLNQHYFDFDIDWQPGTGMSRGSVGNTGGGGNWSFSCNVSIPL